MRLEDLKYDLPKTPDFIHQMITDEVEKQVNGGNIIPMKRKTKTKWKL